MKIDGRDLWPIHLAALPEKEAEWVDVTTEYREQGAVEMTSFNDCVQNCKVRTSAVEAKYRGEELRRLFSQVTDALRDIYRNIVDISETDPGLGKELLKQFAGNMKWESSYHAFVSPIERLLDIPKDAEEAEREHLELTKKIQARNWKNKISKVIPDIRYRETELNSLSSISTKNLESFSGLMEAAETYVQYAPSQKFDQDELGIMADGFEEICNICQLVQADLQESFDILSNLFERIDDERIRSECHKAKAIISCIHYIFYLKDEGVLNLHKYRDDWFTVYSLLVAVTNYQPLISKGCELTL